MSLSLFLSRSRSLSHSLSVSRSHFKEKVVVESIQVWGKCSQIGLHSVIS